MAGRKNRKIRGYGDKRGQENTWGQKNKGDRQLRRQDIWSGEERKIWVAQKEFRKIWENRKIQWGQKDRKIERGQKGEDNIQAENKKRDKKIQGRKILGRQKGD